MDMVFAVFSVEFLDHLQNSWSGFIIGMVTFSTSHGLDFSVVFFCLAGAGLPKDFSQCLSILKIRTRFLP